MTTRSEGKVPDPLPDEACSGENLFRDYVGEGQEYRGHNGCCGHCGAEYKEADDSDLSTAHWMHTRAVALAVWNRDTPPDVAALCRVMDPDDPQEAQDHAERLLAHKGPVMMGG